jgi:surface polysaccharide O-acyltransferase-like enzyme
MEQRRYHGFDYLRAFFSVSVVAVHLGYVGRSAIFSREHFREHHVVLSDVVNFYVLLLAVPVFLLISGFLFLQGTVDRAQLQRSLKRIGRIAVFWIAMYTVFRERGWEVLERLPRTAYGIAVFSLSGGDTIYYFFVSLLMTVGIIYVARRFDLRLIAFLFIGSVLCVAVLPLIAIATGWFSIAVYYDPPNFVPYGFAALLMNGAIKHEPNPIKAKHIVIACVATLALAVLDWTVYVHPGFFSVNSFAVPAYARPSLVLLAMLVVWCATSITRRPGRIVMYMSRNSLALYCLHPFFALLTKQLVATSFLLAWGATIALSYVTAWIAKRFLRPELLL